MRMKRLLVVLPLTWVITGCNAHQQAVAQPLPFQMANPTMQQAYQPPMASSMAMAQADFSQELAALKASTAQEINTMGERVRRVERAMIRLDRRMQVIERNELVKVSGLDAAPAPHNPMAMGRFQPTSFPVTTNSRPSSPFARGAAVLSRTPFASRGHVDTHELNGEHVSIAPLQPAQPASMARPQPGATNPRFASLADAQTERAADTQVAIWTVNYDPRKIWPDRGELAASSEVVTALRAGRPVSIFARGVRPSSKEFRERVRALSRYLGRVANLESVPIAAMPADHLSQDTIELLVAN